MGNLDYRYVNENSHGNSMAVVKKDSKIMILIIRKRRRGIK